MATAHLARFEFSDAGTKVLMVEWLPGAAADADADAAGAAETADAAEAQAQAQAQLPSQSHSHDQSAAGPQTPSGAVSSGSVPGAASGHGGSGPPAPPASVSGADAAPWEVSWPGKSTFLLARDADVSVGVDSSSSGSDPPEAQRRRVFFLLPPDAPVPPTVTITPPGRAPIQVKPLPAIFPEGFGDAEASRPGSRGVLHTIWAKKRLRELEREMDAELRANAESVGLEMALAEKQWIVDSFLRPPPLNVAAAVQSVPGPASPQIPRSPTGRLGEKLKGLRLATSPTDLVPSPTGMSTLFLLPLEKTWTIMC